jgi:hypothetical protein
VRHCRWFSRAAREDWTAIGLVGATAVCLSPSRFIALLSMTGQWRNRLLARSETPFSAVAQTVGFDLGKIEFIFQWGLTDSPSAMRLSG